ncbi:hypothetical protein V6N13_134083 [Hibiscus sabdariffa]|uniref:Uncharacterized protein n=1 Tax=Hibiscus sabdariffa TaxID=183260 RepID=A0ABR2ANI6_9ROSI
MDPIINKEFEDMGAMGFYKEDLLKESDPTLAEKRKKEVALKKSKAISQEEMETEIDGRSLSDSDQKAIWSRHSKESRKTLKLGKKLGLQFIGDEEEVLKEISSLKHHEFKAKEI